jgi:hypothetical protein
VTREERSVPERPSRAVGADGVIDRSPHRLFVVVRAGRRGEVAELVDLRGGQFVR